MREIKMTSDATINGKRVKKNTKQKVDFGMAEKLIGRGLAKDAKDVEHVDRE